jgi:nucleoid-associated protein YgaU
MSIRLDMPREFDLVGSPVLIGGIGTGFEATINYRVHDGHDEVTGFITVGGGTGEHAQFQKRVAVGNASFQLDRLFVEVFEVSAKDGRELHKVTRQVLLATRMVKGYIGYREHTVKAGETLTKIARKHYGTNDFQPIFRANAHQLDDPDVIHPGQVLRVPIGTS